MSSDPRIGYLARKWLQHRKVDVILDVACGYGQQGKQLKIFCGPKRLVGLDVWKPYLLKTKEFKVYDDLLIADVNYLPIKPKSVDLTCACEVIEHLEQEQGKHLMEEFEIITKKQVVMSTPNYDYPQGAINGNTYEIHKSIWGPNQFKKHGYKVTGIGVIIKGHCINEFPILNRILAKLISLGPAIRISELIVAIKTLSQ